MRRSNALRELLEDLAVTFHEERISVDFTSGPSSAEISGNKVNICTNLRDEYNLSVSGAQELRVMVDHLSHEVEHIRESDLGGKKAFVEEWKEREPYYANVAGFVINVLEDIYIDGTRLRRFPGLKGIHAYFVDTQVNSGDHVGGSLSLERRLLAGVWEVAHAGHARGIEKAEDEVRECLAKIRVISNKTRVATTPEERYDLANDAMEAILEVLPDAPDRESQKEIQDAIDRAPTDDLVEGSEPEDAPSARSVTDLLAGNDPDSTVVDVLADAPNTGGEEA